MAFESVKTAWGRCMKFIELKPIKETTVDYEAIEREIIDLLRREIYLPILQSLRMPKQTVRNDKDELLDAIRLGRIVYGDGAFSGSFNASISRGLKQIGATWDRKRQAWRISDRSIPTDIKSAVALGESRFKRRVSQASRQLSEMDPSEIASGLMVRKNFDSVIGKVDSEFRSSIQGITLAPKLSEESKKRISAEWSKNMQLFVQDFTKKEILELREKISEHAMKGNRYESVVKTIQDSFGVTQRKAKFLARQETMLMTTKLKQIRYEDAGVDYYKWVCVAGSSNHPVRPTHKALGDRSKRGELFRWDDPPLLAEDGQYKNPGQDYNCRCYAVPVVMKKR